MCGRIRQAGDTEQYMESLQWSPRELFAPPNEPRYNVAPGSRPLVLHRLGNGSEQADSLFWGYKPSWFNKPPRANANLTTILKGSGMWKSILTSRIIVPCDGWYEWTGQKPHKQPWYISPKDSAPLLMAGITAWRPSGEIDAAHGFALVTDDAAGGMKDLLHDRRPVCLTPDAALAWLNSDVPVNEALELLSTPLPESTFQWYQVTRAMGNSRYQAADASEPINDHIIS